MRRLIKNILPPILLNFIKKIYYYLLINRNKKKIGKEQYIKLYDEDEAAERIDEWGEDNVWNEIQLLFNNKDSKILDLACGTGKNIIDLKKINSEAQIYGCDISNRLLKVAIEKGVDPNFLKCIDATKLDYPADFFDYSYSIGSLEHFTEEGIDAVIDNLHYCTKIGSFHMMPLSKKNVDEGWMKTYQSFHNNSIEWWSKKFERKFSRVYVINSSWNDFISVGKWFLCFK